MQGNNIWDEAIEIEKKLKQLQIENEMYANMKIGPVIHPYDEGYAVKADTEVYSLSEANQNSILNLEARQNMTEVMTQDHEDKIRAIQNTINTILDKLDDPIKIADKCLDKIIEYLDHRSIDIPVSGTSMTAPMVYSEDLKATIQTLREVISNGNNSTINRGS